MEKPESCPFCGANRPIIYTASEDWADNHGDIYKYPHSEAWQVVCDITHGGCGAAGGYRSSEKEAVEAWNRRAALVNSPQADKEAENAR